MEKIKAKKRFGQNFLIDLNIIDKIISNIEINKTVIEIGPGRGALTDRLLEKNYTVYAFEIDKELVDYLKERHYNKNNFHIYNIDILELDILNFIKDNNIKDFVIIGNLPYYITSPIICKLLLSNVSCDFLFMMQYEVAKRVCAKSGSLYGYLSVISQLLKDCSILFKVPNTSFYPIPKVLSAIVLFKNKKVCINNIERFDSFLKNIFLSKRKTLLNNLSHFLDKDLSKSIIEHFSFKENIRSEELSIDKIYELFLFIFNIKEIKSFAKLNLTLEVLNKEKDYHNLKMVNTFVNLYDTIYITSSYKDIVYSNKYIENNVLYKTLDLFKKTYNINKNFFIYLKKNIPISSGLGGESSNSSSLLLLLNEYLFLYKSKEELEKLAKQLGSDNTFCLYKTSALCEKKGDKLTFLNKFLSQDVYLFMPDFGISAKESFSYYKTSLVIDHDLVINSLYNNNLSNSICKNDLLLGNILNISKFRELISYLDNKNILYSMTGSGSMLYFFNLKEEDIIYIKSLYKNYFFLKTKILHSVE